MDRQLEEIHNFRRKSTHDLEWWYFVLNSQKRRACWIQAYENGEQELESWTKTISLLEQLQEGNVYVRRDAAHSLGEMKAKAGIETLIESLQQDEDYIVRWNVAWALGNMEAKENIIIEALRKTLANEEPLVRTSAARALGRLSVFVPSLLEQAKEFVLPLQFEFFSGYLRVLYETEQKELLQEKHLTLLANSKETSHHEIVALIFAWQGKREKAFIAVEKAYRLTLPKVEQLLKGKSPKEVEK